MISEHLKTSLEQLHTESFAWAMRCCQYDEEVAEEVMQNTYLKILEGKAKYAGQSLFKTWLFSVIRYTAIDYFRQAKRVLQQFPEQIGSLPNESNETVDQQAIFQQALKELSPKQQHILHLVFYQNLSIEAAAKVMGVQLGTARTHYKRGKQQLSKVFERLGLSVNGKFISP